MPSAISEMSKVQRSLLLFLETCAVDHTGRVNSVHMNEDDFAIAEQWNKEGFIEFGRIYSKDCNHQGCHWCKLSEQAFQLAHQERRERAHRMWVCKTWLPNANG